MKILNLIARSHSAGPVSNLNRSPRNRKLMKPKFDKINNDVKDQICHMLDNGNFNDKNSLGFRVYGEAIHPVPPTPVNFEHIQIKIRFFFADIIEIKEQEDVYLVKTPPEPTRVKSPEQIVIRSPEPVNWTVPLETTKSFIVTQNISNY